MNSGTLFGLRVGMVLVVTARFALGATYCVAPSGQDSNPGSEAQP